MNNEVKRGKGVDFMRYRRITGYLTGTVSRWNDAKRAELVERRKHTMGSCQA